MTSQPVEGLSRFLRPEDLPWQPFSIDGMPSGVQARVLRDDADRGVMTATLRIPPGWQSDRPHAHSVSEEVFILHGDLTDGEDHLTAGWYAYRPAGMLHGPHRSETGAHLLVMWGGTPDYVYDPQPLDEAAKALVVGPVDIEQIEWANRIGEQGKFVSNFGRKILRYDPITGQDTRYLIVPAGMEGWGPNFHPIHEEIYCLDGEIGPYDDHILTRDCYLHNPAWGIHGYHEHSPTGATILEWHSGPWELIFMDRLAPGGRERPPERNLVWGVNWPSRASREGA